MIKFSQQGVGLVEVLVALVILALGVLGFSALQLRALDAAQEATEQSIAMNTARDLAERIRVNRTALAAYKTAINTKAADDSKLTCIGTETRNASPATKKIDVPKCNPTVMAQHDAAEILKKINAQGQTIIIANCVGSSLNCIYVAWGKTIITASNISQCVDTGTGVYQADTKCLVMEAF
ncbi:type IV pilus modification protein PilV [Acinetobacter sp. C26M]|uniref:type IV pilus modification protein PilV n=1 Tax=unclassified Acinetobacter TaxID=196816 RepID=UPI0020369022|nr:MULTISPECIES: type IV pilus modification protein PilV [unclassified Acinetobacter]USA46854.1 type IV pilus modification protein PilV [Acinetobacter sp. C26M]USA50338.1 type IV pilus modification protein PilV [Acinetobacter sp. C26G]